MKGHAMKSLDLTKPLQTRFGEKAELVYDGLTGDFPLVVIIHRKNKRKTLRTYTREGIAYTDEGSLANLMNVPEKRTIWLNINENWHTIEYSSRDLADRYARSDRIACVEVTYTKGEGL